MLVGLGQATRLTKALAGPGADGGATEKDWMGQTSESVRVGTVALLARVQPQRWLAQVRADRSQPCRRSKATSMAL